MKRSTKKFANNAVIITACNKKRGNVVIPEKDRRATV